MPANRDAHDPLERLSTLLARLPGIGGKTALRLALALVRAEEDYVQALAEAIGTIHGRLRFCAICCDLCAEEICERCRDPRRDRSIVCVIAQPQDRMAIDRAGVFRGLYHVLHGVLDPLGGVGPAELRVDTLLQRIGDGEIFEVIVATSPNVEGDATALYLAKLLRPLGVRVSRIAAGVAVGGELEYADMNTVQRALTDRRTL